MKRLTLLALLLGGCTTYTDDHGTLQIVMNWTGTFTMLFVFVIFPAVVTFLMHRMPAGYSRTLEPCTSGGIYKYTMRITGPEGKLPGSMSAIDGDFTTFMAFNAARTARVHKKMGRYL